MNNHFQFEGALSNLFDFIEKNQLLRKDLWVRFVGQYGTGADNDMGWKGEFWGKMMRGACFVYECTEDPALYQMLTETVADMMTKEEASGRISTYDVDHEFHAWDLWCRKYVLLGMEYYLGICKDDVFAQKIITCMSHQVDYIMSKIGPESEGKKDINTATNNWRGLNSSSILEPVVKLYNLTKEQRFFDFATYIVNQGGTSIVNIFDLAYEDKLEPFRYPVTKAYEMTSCFEGLLEYYKITGNEKYKLAIIRFADQIIRTDFTIIGCSGCTHELFDHSTVRQGNTTNINIMQETCVTVTIMKFFARVLELTENSKYADAFERSFYNAYLGSLNTELIPISHSPYAHQNCETASHWTVEPLPFDSYSPLTAGTRGNGIGGLQRMADDHYYGCCACIASAGAGLLSRVFLTKTSKGIAMNLFLPGTYETETPSGKKLIIKVETEYPRKGLVKITMTPEEPESFTFLIRDPAWSQNTKFSLGNRPEDALQEMPKAFESNGYLEITQLWDAGDAITLSFDMRVFSYRPIAYGHEILMNEVVWSQDVVIPVYDEEDPMAKNHIAFERGPIVFAQDNRLGYSVDDAVSFDCNEDGTINAQLLENDAVPYESLTAISVPLKDGSKMMLTDYASAGKTWDIDSKMAAWMLTK